MWAAVIGWVLTGSRSATWASGPSAASAPPTRALASCTSSSPEALPEALAAPGEGYDAEVADIRRELRELRAAAATKVGGSAPAASQLADVSRGATPDRKQDIE